MEQSRLEERLTSIELRLLAIENALKKVTLPSARMPVAATSVPVSQPPFSTPPAAQKTTATYSKAKPGNWLGIIAIICFVLAAGFIIKLSVESGWLTPARQIGLALLFGLSLIGAGFALMRSDREYASLLPGAGIVVLYLSAFAAHRYYALISFESALVLTSLISGICIFLYTEIKHDVYPITAAVGAYIAPAVLGLNTGAEFSLYYFLLCSCAFAIISVWVQSRILTMISAYLAIMTTAFVGFDIHQNLLIAGILAAHFVIFSASTYFYSTRHTESLTEAEAWSFLPVLLIFYAVEYYFMDQVYPGLAPWISMGFAGVLVGFYLSARKYFPDGLGSQSVILAFATLVCFHSVYLELLPSGVRPWLFVLIMLGFAFLPVNLSAHKGSSPFYIPALALFAILAIEYLTMLFHLLEGYSAAWLIVSFAAFVSIWCALVVRDGTSAKKTTYGHALLGAAHLLAILGLYRLTDDSGSLAVSGSWLLYAVCVMSFAFVRKDEVMAKSALIVLSFAAAKALLCDASSAPTVVRILCLLLTGAVLYGSGFLMRRIADWKE